MTSKFDEVANAVYISFGDEPRQGIAAKTHICDVYFRGGSVHLDVDKNGRLVGIEILGASNVLTNAAIGVLKSDEKTTE